MIHHLILPIPPGGIARDLYLRSSRRFLLLMAHLHRCSGKQDCYYRQKRKDNSSYLFGEYILFFHIVVILELDTIFDVTILIVIQNGITRCNCTSQYVNNNMLFAFSCMVVRIRFIVFTFYAFKERMFCLNVILSSFGV